MEGKIRLSVFFFSPKANMKFQLARYVAGLRAKYKNWKGFLKRKKKTKKKENNFFFKETTTKKKGGRKKEKEN